MIGNHGPINTVSSVCQIGSGVAGSAPGGFVDTATMEVPGPGAFGESVVATEVPSIVRPDLVPVEIDDSDFGQAEDAVEEITGRSSSGLGIVPHPLQLGFVLPDSIFRERGGGEERCGRGRKGCECLFHVVLHLFCAADARYWGWTRDSPAPVALPGGALA